MMSLVDLLAGEGTTLQTVLNECARIQANRKNEVANPRIEAGRSMGLVVRKGERSGIVVRDDGGHTARTGGRMPHGADVEFAYRTGSTARPHLRPPRRSTGLQRPAGKET